MARAARSNYESTSEEFDTKRLAVMIGGGLAVVLAVVFLGVKMFGSKGDAPKAPVPAVARAPQYPQQVTDLVAQTEEAFKADDFKTARADIDKLRQLSPSHPRLGFFEGLLTAKADTAAKGGAANSSAGRGGSKKNAKSSAPAGTSPSSPSKVDTEPALASTGAASASHSSAAPSTRDGSSQGAPVLPPETPVGFSRAGTAAGDQGTTGAGTGLAQGMAPASSGGAAAGVGSMSGPSMPPGSASASGGASTSGSSAAQGLGSGGVSAASGSGSPAASAPTSSPSSASSHRGSGEPPPVIQEAKLIRRVNPDYPSVAKKDGIAGSVDLEVTVSTQGVVEDVSIIQSTPPEMFDKSALAAVRKWKYEPRFIDGLPSQAHLKVHLDFGPIK